MNDFVSFFHFSNHINIIAYIGLLFLLSQTFGRLSNFIKSPHILGYLLAGILFGPSVLNLFSYKLVNTDLSIITDITLSIIAFSIGGSLKLNILKQYKKSILWITISQALGAFILVFIACLFFLPIVAKSVEATNGFARTYLPISLILASIFVATAPASIISIIHEYKAKKGPFTNVLLGIITIDDAIALIFYSFALAFTKNLVVGESIALNTSLIQPLISILLAIAIGLIIGIFLKWIISFCNPKDVLLGIILGAILFTGGLAITLGVSPLLANMTLGIFIANWIMHKKADEAFNVIDSIEEPIFGIFFLIAGAQLNIALAYKAAILTLMLLITRSLGKYLGSYLGGSIASSSNAIKKFVGLSLFPTAGVTIGLVLEADIILSKYIPILSDIMVNAVIGATLINELISPFFVRYSLLKAKEIKP